MDGHLLVGVDVGSTSVRAALMTEKGVVLKVDVRPIKVWNPYPNYYEQSSVEIWDQTCKAVKEVCRDFDVQKIKGIGFAATCSLVVLSSNFFPVNVSTSGEPQCNVIMWMDHRAINEADFINEKKNGVLRSVGDKISPEMQIPKLLWLKRNNPTWHIAGHFMDLADFLTWSATDSLERSMCTLVCKWTYQASESLSEWDEEFFKELELEDLLDDDFAKIGSMVIPPGSPVGQGVSPKAAEELGLAVGTAVAASLIDAHAGGIGVTACQVKNVSKHITKRLGLICGTSTCHMIVSKEPYFIPGVWGPYYGGMVPHMWLTEGGQSASGSLIDHIIENHPIYLELKNSALANDLDIHTYLHDVLSDVASDEKVSISELTKNVHVYPDFHGNRSPLANPNMHGMITGLSFDLSQKSLAVMYLATIQALAYQTRQIIKTLQEYGHTVDTVHICGGLSKITLFVQEHSDILGLPVVVPDEPESVLLGAGMIGACAAGIYPRITYAMEEMGGTGKVVFPSLANRSYHGRKYLIFEKMMNDQIAYRKLMSGKN